MQTVDKRRMCPNCRAFISTDDKVCQYCDFKLGPRVVERRTSSDVGGLIPAGRFTTTVILFINAGLYVAGALYGMQNPRQQDVLMIAGASGPEIFRGDWWRLITAGFLHAGIIHILMNSWVIFDLGVIVEEFYGTARYLVFYFLSTVAGFYVSASTGHYSVGASAALFGLIGAMLALGVRQRGTSLGEAVRAHFMQWAIWGIATSFIPGLRTDWAAHLGGLAGGFIVAYLAGTPPLYERWTGQAWRIAAAVCVLITIAAFVKMLLSL
ncbi:MAG: rhomboid family intramembrane serine protease [Bryobacteraceae bacterium]|nr:rhomboid family intramembrane serine protease [Bryobacteraceae bacterium]